MSNQCTLPLPQGYKATDFFAYHLRDPEKLSERLVDDRLEKGLMIDGCPGLLSIELQPQQAVVRLETTQKTLDSNEFHALSRRLLGLDQPIQPFEETFKDDPHLGSVIQRQQGLRVAVTATPYEALVWAITGQQISVAAAIAIRRRLVQAAGVRLDNGLWCHPDTTTMARVDSDTLRTAGLSSAKIRALQSLNQALNDGHLTLPITVTPANADDLQTALLALPGIGPWTANYTLLRGYGWPDGSLHGDAAVRRALQRLLNLEQRPDARFTEDWLRQYAPWRALAAAHLWAANKVQA